MTVYLYSGTPGSGKSLDLAQLLYKRCQYLKCTVSNFDINCNFDKRAAKNKNKIFKFLSNSDMTPNALIDFSKKYFENHKFKEGSILLCIDECQLKFNAREWNVKGREDWLSFFTQHRKYGYDIILIAQFDRMIDRQIRSLIEYQIIHRKVSNFGVKGKIFSLFAGGNLFVGVKIWYPLNERISSHFFRYSKKYSQIYDTYNTF